MFTGHPDTLAVLVRQRHQLLAHEAHQTRLRHQLNRRRRKT
jgi:hypothetical protein